MAKMKKNNIDIVTKINRIGPGLQQTHFEHIQVQISVSIIFVLR